MALSKTSRIGISDLALLSRINHQRCLANVEWMEQQGFVKIESGFCRKDVIVTEEGRLYINKLLSLPLPSDSFEDTNMSVIAPEILDKTTYKM
jgi:predicted transcriptional regulator